MFWDIPDDEGEEMSQRVQEILTRISEIKEKRMVSIKDSQEMERLRAELEKIQSVCVHHYEEILLFHRHRRFCKWCDKEDLTYVRQP